MAQASALSREGMQLIGRFLRAHPRPFAVSVLGSVGYSAAAVAVPAAVGHATNAVISPAFGGGVTGATVLGALTLILALGIVRAGSIFLRRYWAATAELAMQRTLRRSLIDTYLRASLSFYHRHPTGELMARTDADVVGTTNAIKALPFSLGIVALALFALVSLALVDWTFAVVALLLFPALTALNHWYTGRVTEVAGRSQALLGEVSSIAHESIDGVLVVKALGIGDLESERFAAAVDALRRSELEVGRLRSTFDPVLDALPNLGTLVLFAVGGWRIQSGAVTPGDLVQAALLFAILSLPMRVFGFFLEEVPRSLASIARIDAVLDEPDERADDQPTTTLPDGPLPIEFDQVSFGYGTDPVLEGVTFVAPAGATTALVGSTGCGKSTLVYLLGRLLDPDGGSIRVGGVDVADLDRDDLRAAVRIVFQETYLFHSSLRSNVELGAGGSVPDAELAAAADTAQVTRFLDDIDGGWDAVLGERGVTLSGGQRQRVAVARALVGAGRVLVLDDATSAVDPVVEAQMLRGIASQGVTTLVVAHRLSVLSMADQVVYLDQGRVVDVGPHHDLLARHEGYRSLVRAYEDEESA